MQKISIQELVAINETPRAKALLVRYGYKPARNIDELVYMLFRFTREYREEALEELTKLHPHRSLILHYQDDKGLSRSGRFSSFEMEEQLDFLGGKSKDDSSPKNSMQTINDYLPLIAVAGLFALTITAISK